MRSALPILGTACLLGGGLIGLGCRAGEPGSCGRPTPSGEIRFCSDDGNDNQICICSTGRCAKTGDNNCAFGLRYVYGDEECVSEQDLMVGGFILSDGSGAACLDAPVVRPPARYQEEQRVDPRLIRFDDRVLLETVDPYPASDTALNESDPARVFVQRLGWDGRPEEGPATSVDLRSGLPGLPDGMKLAVHGSHSWGGCDVSDSGGPRSAVFAHWLATEFGRRPILLRASSDAGGPTLENITPHFFGRLPTDELPGHVLDFRVVGTTNGCWVVWIDDDDGPGGSADLTVKGRGVSPVGTLTDAVALMSTNGTVEFWGAAPFPGGAEGPALMAAADARGVVVVAVPVRDAADNSVGLWARGIRPPTSLFPSDGHAEVASFSEASSECGSGGCAGLVYPEFNAVAAQGDRFYFAYVLEGAAGSGRRTLFLGTTNEDLGQAAAPFPLGDLAAPLAGPTLVPRPGGGVFGAVMGWSGDFGAPAAPLHLLHAEATDTGPWTMEKYTLPSPTAVLPLLAVDDDGFLLVSYATLQRGAAVDLRLSRRHPTVGATAPTWPDGGVPYAPPDPGASGLGPGDIGLLSNSVATPLPRPDGGALTAWTTPDQHVEIALLEAVR